VFLLSLHFSWLSSHIHNPCHELSVILIFLMVFRVACCVCSSAACSKHSIAEMDPLPVVVVGDEKGVVVALLIIPGGVGERHTRIAAVHRPHPELHGHLCLWEVGKVGDQQHLHA